MKWAIPALVILAIGYYLYVNQPVASAPAASTGGGLGLPGGSTPATPTFSTHSDGGSAATSSTGTPAVPHPTPIVTVPTDVKNVPGASPGYSSATAAAAVAAGVGLRAPTDNASPGVSSAVAKAITASGSSYRAPTAAPSRAPAPTPTTQTKPGSGFLQTAIGDAGAHR